MEGWLSNLLGIKGEATKPQEWDTSKCVPVVDLGQGGFSNEDSQYIVDSGSLSIGAPASYRLYHPGVSCRHSSGGTPGNAPANNTVYHARVLRASIQLYFDEAGVAARTDRFVRFQFGLTGDTGLQIWLQAEVQPLNDLYGYYHANMYSMIVPDGYEFAMRVELLASYGAGEGLDECPANTTALFTCQAIKKPLGGQLPL